jgi:hypothetical protein
MLATLNDDGSVVLRPMFKVGQLVEVEYEFRGTGFGVITELRYTHGLILAPKYYYVVNGNEIKEHQVISVLEREEVHHADQKQLVS